MIKFASPFLWQDLYSLSTSRLCLSPMVLLLIYILWMMDFNVGGPAELEATTSIKRKGMQLFIDIHNLPNDNALRL